MRGPKPEEVGNIKVQPHEGTKREIDTIEVIPAQAGIQSLK